MKTRVVEQILAKHYEVNCEENDPQDIKCGGPRYLGYDFFVDASVPEDEIKNHIKSELENNNQPFISIRVYKPKWHNADAVWDKKRISECIKNDHY